MPTNIPEDPGFAEKEREIRGAARGARDDRDRLALKLAASPDDKAVADDLQAIEDELNGYRTALDRLAGARRAAAAAAAANTSSALQARLDQHRKAALAAAADRVKAATKVERALTDLAAALAAEATAGALAWHQVVAASRLLPEGQRRSALGLQGAAAGHPGPALWMLSTALRSAETHGGKLGHFVSLHGLSSQPTPRESAEAELANLTAGLARWSVESEDVAADQADEFAEEGALNV